jgi:outer membrane lipoprotein-sorting protein
MEMIDLLINRKFKINKLCEFIVLILILSLYPLSTIETSNPYKEVVYDKKRYDFRNITSIQYQEVKEAFGTGDGRHVESSTITYVFPDKLRIESNKNIKTVEVYNNDLYMYYNEANNKIKLKECFPPEKPYVTEIEKKMVNILNSGQYEFFGYEEKDNRKLEIIGVKTDTDGHSYMHKMWIGDINDAILPFKEEYFIDDTVVSQTTYRYLKVNEPISPDLFNLSSLPNVETVRDGVIPRYVESYEEAQSYLNFKLVIPHKFPIGFLPSEIAVIPPAKKPSFYCIYFKDGYRIYFNEKNSDTSVHFDANTKLGNFPCKVTQEDEQISIMWRQNKLTITLSGDEEVANEIIEMAEQMSGGRLESHTINVIE